MSASCRRRRELGLSAGLWAPPQLPPPGIPPTFPEVLVPGRLRIWKRGPLVASSLPCPPSSPREGPSRSPVSYLPTSHLLSIPSPARPCQGLWPSSRSTPRPPLHRGVPVPWGVPLSWHPTPVSEGHSPSRLGENRSSLSFLQERGMGGAKQGPVVKRLWGFRTTARWPPRGALTIQLWGSEVQGGSKVLA